MNEMRHVLTSLRTPAKSSSLNSGIATSSAATATWYDIPTPIIVHCREFREEAGRDAKKNDDARNRRGFREEEMGNGRFIEGNATAAFDIESSSERDARVRSPKDANVGCSEKDATSNRPEGLSLEGSFDSVDKASCRSSQTQAADANGPTRVHVSDSLEAKPAESRVNERTRDGKRRGTSMELNATATVKTDVDGVPTISFSFLRADENFHEDDDEIVILEVDTSDQADSSGNQSYDLPKSAVLESNRVSLERPGNDKEINSSESSLPVVRQDLYDVPRSMCENVPSDEPRDDETVAVRDLERERSRIADTIVSPERKDQQRDRMKRSTRSLTIRSGRRSYGTSDSDGYDAGIASMSGSYSDPEACPNEEAALSENGDSDRGKRQLRLRKQRLGKAWGRMRSWLREERMRIGQVVNRHAKLQAVGALAPEVGCR